jgi:2-dehydropantoate 2-reductase
LGELDGPVTKRLENVAAVWRAAGFTVKTFDDINQLVWEKLICNVCFSGPCAVLEMNLGQVMGDEDAWRVACGCASEAFNVAKARGIYLSFAEPVEYLRAFGSKMPEARPSMLLDHMAGRASEIDAINGAIPPEGEKCGVPAPYNTVVSSLVRAKERRLGLR